jgi:pimeloyl-ACP methyl ester carboxylesterase
VHAVTLTGDGERAHLRRREIGLAGHVADVLALVEAEELGEVMLVGHSYGGMVITGAADALLARGTVRLTHLVYVDAVVPLPGESWSSLHTPEVRAQRETTAAANDHALPPADPALFGIEGADRDWLLRRQVPHPFGPYHEPLPYDGPRLAGVPRTYLACTAPAFGTVTAHLARVRAQPAWRVIEMATGHCPMVTQPAELAAHLLACAGAAPR